FLDPLLGGLVSRRQLCGDVQTLLGDGAIVEPAERLGAAEHPVEGAVTSRADQGGQVGFPRVQSRAAEASRRAPDREEGVTDRNHALPAAALEGCAVGVLPDANGDVDVPVLELLLDDG